MTRTPLRPGNDFRRRPFLDRFEKGLLYVNFTIFGAGFIGLLAGLIIGAVGK